MDEGRILLSATVALLMTAWFAPISAAAGDIVDASTLDGKVMAGYQAWFRCPGDPADLGWRHWCDRNRFEPATVHTDFWPDMSAYGSIRKYPAPGFTDAQGNQSYCYSACDPVVILRHFEWMRTYDIDGIWLQHFAVAFPRQAVK